MNASLAWRAERKCSHNEPADRSLGGSGRWYNYSLQQMGAWESARSLAGERSVTQA